MAPPVALTIAGSDPSGGAGVQADLKTFSSLGAYGTSVLTALTAQNTRGVTGIHPVPADFVRLQLHTLVEDVRIDTVKVGMLASAELVQVVADFVTVHRPLRLVVDPVMVATSGDRLLDEDAVDALRALVPHADLVTPNLAEAALLAGSRPATDLAAMVAQGESIRGLGAKRVLVKGGHLTTPGRSTDVLVTAEGAHEIDAPRVSTRNTHGTGCSLSSAIAALAPQRDTWQEAVIDAKAWLTQALRRADELHVGHGHGPVHHFHQWWSHVPGDSSGLSPQMPQLPGALPRT